MIYGFGISTWALLAAVVIVLVGAGIWLLRGRGRAHRFGAGDQAEGSQERVRGRLEVLETTPVDADRTLLLVRCDEIEHLMLIGGAADIVVDSDVRGRRAGLKAFAPSAAGQHQAKPAPAGQESQRSAPADAASERRVRPQPQVPARAQPPSAAAEPSARNDQTSSKNGASAEAPAADLAPEGARRPERRLPAAHGEGATEPRAIRRPQPLDAKPIRRDFAQPPTGRAPQPQAASPPPPHASGGPQPPAAEGSAADERQPRQAGAPLDPAKQGVLPAAEIPWGKSDKVETEIVRALRADAGRAAQPVASRAPGRDAADPTTLGDLADRLEEALAREVQTAGQQRKLDSSLDSFSFGREHGEPERPTPRVEPPRAMPAAPDAEPRREVRATPERQEEAPVINLSARRREPVDPLEDEMARLLGELTGDTTRR